MKLLALCAIIGAVFGALAAVSVPGMLPKSDRQMMREFYETESAVSISPSDYVRHMRAGITDGILVDLRSKGEYEKGHLVTAVNIPVGQISRSEILGAFRELPKDKAIITYCYSSYCMLSRHIGEYLAENGIYSMHLTAGWYEINRDYGDFIATGPVAGSITPAQMNSQGLCPPGTSGFEC